MPEWSELVDLTSKVLEMGQIDDDKDGIKEERQDKIFGEPSRPVL